MSCFRQGVSEHSLGNNQNRFVEIIMFEKVFISTCLGYNPPGNISTGRTTPESTQCSWSPAPCSPLSPGSTPGTNLCPAQLTLQRSTSLLKSKLFDNDKLFFKGDIFCQFSGVEPVFCVSTGKCLSTFLFKKKLNFPHTVCLNIHVFTLCLKHSVSAPVSLSRPLKSPVNCRGTFCLFILYV